MAAIVPAPPHTSLRKRLARLRAWLDHPGVDITVTTWLGVAGIIALLSIVLRQPIIFVIALGIAIVGLGTRLWWDACFRSLTYTRSLSTDRAFFGDTVTIDFVTVNAKPLPLTRMEVTEHVSTNVHLIDRKLEPAEIANRRLLRSVLSLGMYERISHKYQVRCEHRGWYRFGPTRMIANDLLGLVARQTDFESVTGFLVYPRTVPVTEVIVPARQPFGDFTPRQSLVEDPLRMSGVREYVPGDSPRRIHWRASARTGTLQTRTFEPSATPIAAIFLDTITFSHLWEGQDSATLELSVVTAASLANQLLAGRHQVGMYANAPLPGRSRTLRLPPGRRPGQRQRILEELAMLSPAYGDRIEKMLVEELPRLPWGSTIVIVTSRVTEGMQRSLLRLTRTSGAQRFVIIAIGDEPQVLPDLRRRIPVYHLGGDNAWDTIDSIHLTRQV